MNPDSAFTELVQTKLQQTSPEVDCLRANGVDETLDNLHTERIDCIVTAYSLDDANGIELTDSIRQRDEDIPIILFTGQGSEEIASEATRAGVSDYIPLRSERDNFTLLAARIQTLTRAARERENAEQTRRRFQRTLERTTDAVYAVDSKWRIEYMNERMAKRVDRDPDAVVGKTIWEEFPSIVGTELEAKYRTAMETGEPVSFEQYLEEPFNYWVAVRVFPDSDGLTVFSREITDDQKQELKAEPGAAIVETIRDIVFVLNETGHITFANTAAKRVLAGNQSAQLTGQRLETVVGDRISDSDMTRFSKAINSARANANNDRGSSGLYDTDLQLDIVVGTSKQTFDVRATTFQTQASNQVLAVARNITEQKQLETRLRSLQETAQQLSHAESSDEIGTIAVDAAAKILDLEITGIWEYDEQEEALVPITETPTARDLIGESPRFTPGDSLAWDAFESGEINVYDDVQAEGQPLNPNTEIRSEILVPLGGYGLMATGSASKRVFSETDIDLFRILGATVEAALARASREEELQRQNERLDQFASVVAHDLRNPLSVASGFLEVAKETGQAEHFERAESAHDRIGRLIDDLLTLARGETTIENTEQIELEDVATEAWGYVDTDAATLTLADDVPTVAGDAKRLTQLFENLFRNAVEHGGADVTVTVGGLDDRLFYVEDTGSGIPEAMRDDVFDHGVTSHDGGTGFGLSIVADIAEAHGWTVSVTDGTDGGARFNFKQSK
ncbi:ATP-binding protein [Halobaculum sp. MBLA0147]|uniref:ATP-binding protein n=1 Tax=Halobaculum sp. MBLA0147 TaxID=3079934 RepID=UPI0035239D46